MNWVFENIQDQIKSAMAISDTPYQAARHIAVANQLPPYIARMLLEYINSIWPK